MSLGEKFEQWMEIESSYALGKFPVASQYPYWEAGVTRGHFSFRDSALNYLRRAEAFSEEAEVGERGGLQLVQSMGKAAHNLIALDAAAWTHESRRGLFIAREVGTISSVAAGLEVYDPITPEQIRWTTGDRREIFDELQVFQDQENMEEFLHMLDQEIRFAADQFATVAKTYGWPTPGVSSGEISPWNNV